MFLYYFNTKHLEIIIWKIITDVICDLIIFFFNTLDDNALIHFLNNFALQLEQCLAKYIFVRYLHMFLFQGIKFIMHWWCFVKMKI